MFTYIYIYIINICIFFIWRIPQLLKTERISTEYRNRMQSLGNKEFGNAQTPTSAHTGCKNSALFAYP